MPKGYAPWAIARGEMIGAAHGFCDHPEVRKALIRVFERPPLPSSSDDEASNKKPVIERRKTMLRNDEIIRWYGMTSEVLPIIALDDARERFPTRRIGKAAGVKPRAPVRDNSRPVLARLGSALRTRADPSMQDRIVRASTGYLKDSRHAASHSPSLEANTKLGLKLALIYLPQADRLGGAARFDPLGWKTPARDAPLWRMLLDLRRGGALHSLPHARRRQLRIAIGVMRRVYGPFLAGLSWSAEVERVVCDLAIALSPISVDPHIAFAIHALGHKPKLRSQLGAKARRSGFVQ